MTLPSLPDDLQERLRRTQQILRDAQHDEEARQYFVGSLMPQEIAQDFHVEMLIESFSHPFYWAAFTCTGL
jgi:CHAT domain-containing protein